MGGKARLSAAQRVLVNTRAELRAWLALNHKQQEGIWLAFYKKGHKNYLPWPDIVQEAICFGWIDSTTRRLDDARTMLYLSPRKVGSPWSAINKKHIRELEAKGLLAPAGKRKIAAAKRDGSWTLLDDIEALIVPRDLQRAFKESPGSREGYESLTPGARKGLLWWIKSAKTDSTRAVRIEKTVAGALRGVAANV